MDSSLSLESPPSLSSIMRGGPVALFLDFDGTLVELAPGPDAIAPVADLSDRLARLALRVESRCAIVSGRAIADIEKHLGPLSIAAAGSHGTDIRNASGTKIGRGPSTLPPAIEREMGAFADANGLDLERKPHGAALHYRSNPTAGAQAHRFAETLAANHGWAVQSGKFVVELVAKGASKGAAVETFMSAPPFAGSRPIFIGDDLTDEAGFKVCQSLGGLAVLVGERAETHAQFSLPGVSAVHQWLEL